MTDADLIEFAGDTIPCPPPFAVAAPEQFPVVCGGCLEIYTAAGFEALEYVARATLIDRALEIRACPCGHQLAIEVTK